MTPVCLALPPVAGGAWRYVWSTPSGTVQHAERPPAGKGRLCILVAPGETCPVRRMTLRGETPAQQRAAALLDLADDLAEPPEGCVVALGPATGGMALVSVASRRDLEAQLAAARARGFVPDRIMPECCLLQEPSTSEWSAALREDRLIARGSERGFSCEEDLSRILFSGQTVAERDLETDVREAIRSGRVLTELHFDPALGRIEASKHAGALQRLAAGLILAGAITAAIPMVSAIRQDGQAASLRRAAADLALGTLPTGAKLVNARAQLAEQMTSHLNGKRVTTLSRVLIAELGKLPSVRMIALEGRAGEALTVRLEAASGTDFSGLRASLTASGAEMTDPVSPVAERPDFLEFQVRSAP
ncbi:MAG: hypothetical protein KGS00_12630 [Alphaproteobacteria bacterium]|nr:hypothetical protein [Alphaproteobacteria bacterium]